MKKEEQIIQGLRLLGKRKTYTYPCIIKSVNEPELTCTVQYDDIRVEGVRITASTDKADTQTYFVPKTESWVLVSNIETSDTDAVIVAFTEIEKIVVQCENVEFNGGQNGGLIRINDLIAKINAIENDLNTLKNVFSMWVTVLGDGGASLKTASTTWSASTLQNTVVNDIENPKIKH